MITYREYPELRTVEVTVDGKVTEQDFHSVIPKLKAFIVAHGKVKLIEIVKDFDGFDWSVVSDSIKFDMEHMKDFTHMAVVTDSGWIGPFVRMLSPFFSAQLKTFKMNEEAEARAWLQSS